VKGFKVFIAFILMSLIFSSAAVAKDDSFRASVEKLLILMKVDKYMDQSFEQIKPIILERIQEMSSGELTKEQSKTMEKYMEKLFNLMKAEMSWDKIKEDYIELYMSVYTKEEVNELIKFYQSPIGQKTIEKMPVIMEKSTEISYKYLMNMIPKIEELAAEMQEEFSSCSKN